MFRAIADEAIVNRMGFNNPGAEARRRNAGGMARARPLAGSSGRHQPRQIENHAARKGRRGLRQFLPRAAAASRISSSSTSVRPTRRTCASSRTRPPSTKSWRRSRKPKPTPKFRTGKWQIRNPKSAFRHKPILVKVAPDLSFEALDEILELAGPRQIAGIVATNTTISRPQTGAPALRRIYAETGGLERTTIAGAQHRDHPASLPADPRRIAHHRRGRNFQRRRCLGKNYRGRFAVQIYTGLVYEGPGIAREIVSGLIERLEAAGMTRLQQAVGLAVKPID